MGISIGFGLGPIRVSAPLGSGQRQHYGYTTAQYMAAGRPRHPAWKTIGVIAAIPAGLFLVLFQWAMFAANGFWAGLIWLLMQLVIVACIVLPKAYARRADKIRRKAEVVARADYEHAAVMRGDYSLGVHGAFPPL